MSYPVYRLILHPSYYKKGFYNLGAEVDRYVRQNSGPCTLHLGNSGEQLDGRVNREANTNRTARIHAGAKLRDLFYRHFDEMDGVDMEIEAPDVLRIRKQQD